MFSYVSHTSGKFVVSVCSREGFVFLKRNLDTGTDETIRIMPCVMMYQSKRSIQTRGDYSEKDFF